jgi:hypothetical protein
MTICVIMCLTSFLDHSSTSKVTCLYSRVHSQRFGRESAVKLEVGTSAYSSNVVVDILNW